MGGASATPLRINLSSVAAAFRCYRLVSTLPVQNTATQFTRTQPIYNRSFSTTKCCRTGCFTQLSSAYFSPCLFTISRHRRKEGRSRLLRLLVVGGINQQKTGIAYNKNKQTNKQKIGLTSWYFWWLLVRTDKWWS